MGVPLTATAGVRTGALDSQNDGGQGFAAGTHSGVFGRNNDKDGTGVYGVAPNGTGSFGESLTGTRAGGRSNSGAGVRGESTSGTGVTGKSSTGVAVYGVSPSNVSVRGDSTTSIGVYGTSSSSYGLFGDSSSGAGIQGRSQAGPGLVGQAMSTLAYAGDFYGKVIVRGDFSVTGAKNALVAHPDGSHRRMYCVEAPESWFEDVGEGKLQNGRADVKLDPDFAAVVRGDRYLIFLTEIGDSGGLYVANQAPTSFEVRARGTGTPGGSFHYKVMAKRKDIPGPRLEKVDPPKKYDTPNIPQAPAASNAESGS